MFTPSSTRMFLVVACLAAAVLVGCAKPPEPCTVGESEVGKAQADLKKAERELEAAMAEVKDLEAEYDAKAKRLKDLEAQKAELDKLKSKVEGDGPPKR